MTLIPHIGSSNKIAHVWPSRLAMEQALSGAAKTNSGGVLLLGGHFTQENFLPEAVRLLALEQNATPLSDLAGALLVQRLLHQNTGGIDVFQGLRRGWRLPSRLWRLLVEIRAGALSCDQLREVGGERCDALANLLAEYEKALGEMGLEDQADGINRLEKDKGGLNLPWTGLVFHDVMWLRSLDMRLIRVLSVNMPVTVQFSLPPQYVSSGSLSRLQENSAKYLEASKSGLLSIEWQYAPDDSGMSKLVGSLLQPGGSTLDAPPTNLDLIQASGRYSEVEWMLQQANRFIGNGAEPHKIALVFPDIALYGQMVRDVAGRMKLPVDISSTNALSDSPIINDLLELLALPANGYQRQTLADSLDSPLIGPALCTMLGCNHIDNPEFLLIKAGYIDGRETPPGEFLEHLASFSNGADYRDIAELCLALQRRLIVFSRQAGIASFVSELRNLLDELGLESLCADSTGRPAVQVAELKALDSLRRTCRDLADAAELAGWTDPLSQGRLLSLLKQCLDAHPAPSPKGPSGGIQVLRLDQTIGASFDFIIVGGLAQGEFPHKTQAAHLLSSAERLALGGRARMPIWRTDDEEYSGQMMRLAGLMFAAQEHVALCCPGADSSGAELEPAYVIREASRLTGMEFKCTTGGVFGSVPSLDQCTVIPSLLGSLAASKDKLHEKELAGAILHWLTKDDQIAKRWREINQKSTIEANRGILDTMLGPDRVNAADSFNGAIESDNALGILADLLDDTDRRKVSPSLLENYALCPMRWYLARLIEIRPLDEPDLSVSGSQEGELVHSILAAFFKPDEFDPTWDIESRTARLTDCLESEFNKQHGGHPFAREARRLALRKHLEAVVEQQWPLFSGGMLPVAVEAEISGADGEKFEILVPDGAPLVINGRLDRLDASNNCDQGILRVVDYKHTNDIQSIRNMANTKYWLTKYFQLAIYMAGSSEVRKGNIDTIQGMIVATRKPHKNPKPVELQADDPLINDGLFASISGLWKDISGGVFVAAPSNASCQYCDFSGACRARVNPAATEEGQDS